MLQSLQTGVSGIQNFQDQLNVIGNNIANANTFGFKSARADFADAFNESIGVAADGTPIQVGTGLSLSGVRTNFGVGTFSNTTNPSDLAIKGDGFFIVQDPVSKANYATRSGDFEVKDGYLLTPGGMRVQGFKDPALSTWGDIQIDAAVRPTDVDPNAKYTTYSIDDKGLIHVYLDNNKEYIRGQVLLQNFASPASLVKTGNNLYSNLDSALPVFTQSAGSAGIPGTAGLGPIQANSLELSNVDLASEFANLIVTQRGFQASARIVTTSDELLQEIVNLKR